MANHTPSQDFMDDDGEDVFELEENDDIVIEDAEGNEMEEFVDNSELSFKKHTDSVFCCNFDKNGGLAVSGSQDHKAYVWDTSNAEEKFVSVHSDSVIQADFSHDNSLLATAGMDGFLKVYETSSGRNVFEYEAGEFTWMKWHPSANFLFAGSTDMLIYKFGDFKSELYQDLQFNAYGSESSCAALLPQQCNEPILAAGYSDGSVRLWNTIKGGECIASAKGTTAHSDGVVSMGSNKEGSLIVTGSLDGTVKLFKVTDCKVLKTWECSKSVKDEKEAVEAVEFLPNHPYVATGTNMGNLRVFDISTSQERFNVELGGPIVKIICSKTSHVVYFISGHTVRAHDGRSSELIKLYEGHSSIINDFALSQDERRILTASDDLECKIFNVS